MREVVIVQVRGSSCSGKSSAVTYLLNRYPPIDELWERGWNKKRPKLTAHLLPGDLLVCGGYSSTTKTGGLDALGSGWTQRVWEWLEWQALRHRHVVFEGLMYSLVLGRTVDLQASLERHGAPCLPYVATFLDTPLQVVLPRLLTRSGGRGQNPSTGEGVNVHGSGVYPWQRCRLVKESLEERGVKTDWLRWRSAGEDLEALLRSGGWDPTGGDRGVVAAPSPWWFSLAALQRGSARNGQAGGTAAVKSTESVKK